jgi:hypothetical protein
VVPIPACTRDFVGAVFLLLSTWPNYCWLLAYLQICKAVVATTFFLQPSNVFESKKYCVVRIFDNSKSNEQLRWTCLPKISICCLLYTENKTNLYHQRAYPPRVRVVGNIQEKKQPHVMFTERFNPTK